MRISSAGLALIREFEGLRLEAYRDGGGALSVGYGHTGADVHEGMRISEATAERLLRQDVESCEACVERCVNVSINQNEFDALVSFVFNVGCGAFFRSTLLRLLNCAERAGAKEQFKRWSKDNGKEIAGLVRRRAAEAALFAANTTQPTESA